MRARLGRTVAGNGLNTSRNGIAPKLWGERITTGMMISRAFSKRFREQVVGKSKWAKEWNRIKGHMARKTNNRKRRNSSLAHELDTLDVARMSEKFHGRAALDEFEIDETEHYDKNLAVLGDLVELNVIDPNKPKTEFTISFKKDRPLLCCNAKGSQLEIISGDQTLPIAEANNSTDKHLIQLGPIRTISYFTDKHHLEGSRDQANGVEYEHEFGEEGGNRPIAVYDTRSCKILIVGGDYTVEAEGIAN